MKRAAPLRQSFTARHAGYYLEDNENYYTAKLYYHPQEWKRKVAGLELIRARYWLYRMRQTSSAFHNQGLHPTYGTGPFEHELQRRGIPIHKYTLPTTTGIKRVHDMTVLRRLELEKQSQEALQKARAGLRQPRPSSWYDESKGPLNPHFLERMASHYTEVDITLLPVTPYIPSKESNAQVQSLK